MTQLKATTEDVRHAYRLLLGREPDDGGLAHYTQLISQSGYSAVDLAQHFLASEEFRRQQGGLVNMVEVPMDGYVMFASPADRDVGAVLVRGERYEPYVEAVVREVLRTGDVFVDVGANIGYFTALAAHLVGSQGRVLAFEPISRNVQLIYATLQRNRFTHVTVYPLAVSSQTALVGMTSDPVSSNAGIAPHSAAEHRGVLAQTQRLDDLLAGLDRLDLVKFDIEGHEMFAWEGARQLLARHRPRVLTEFHPKCIRDNTGRDPAQYLDMLLEWGGAVDVLHRKRPRVTCRDVASILQEWQRADDDFGTGGAMHIDLYIEPR